MEMWSAKLTSPANCSDFLPSFTRNRLTLASVISSRNFATKPSKLKIDKRVVAGGAE
jgi:hypothetical protein